MWSVDEPIENLKDQKKNSSRYSKIQQVVSTVPIQRPQLQTLEFVNSEKCLFRKEGRKKTNASNSFPVKRKRFFFRKDFESIKKERKTWFRSQGRQEVNLSFYLSSTQSEGKVFDGKKEGRDSGLVSVRKNINITCKTVEKNLRKSIAQSNKSSER